MNFKCKFAQHYASKCLIKFDARRKRKLIPANTNASDSGQGVLHNLYLFYRFSHGPLPRISGITKNQISCDRVPYSNTQMTGEQLCPINNNDHASMATPCCVNFISTKFFYVIQLRTLCWRII